MVVKVQSLALKPQRAGTRWKTPGRDSPSSRALISEATSPPLVVTSSVESVAPILLLWQEKAAPCAAQPHLFPPKELVLETHGEKGEGGRDEGKEGNEVGCESLSQSGGVGLGQHPLGGLVWGRGSPQQEAEGGGGLGTEDLASWSWML